MRFRSKEGKRFSSRMSVENLLSPAEVLQRQTGVPYFGHVRDLVTFELHHVDVIRSDSPPSWRNRPALAGMGPRKYSRNRDSFSGDVCRERPHLVVGVRQHG